MAYGFPTHTGVVIANGTSLSGPVDLRGRRLIAIQFPTGWDAADVTFRAGPEEGGPFVNVFASLNEGTDTEVEIGAAADQITYLDTNMQLGNTWLLVRSGTSGTPVAQTGDATLLLYTVDIG